MDFNYYSPDKLINKLSNVCTSITDYSLDEGIRKKLKKDLVEILDILLKRKTITLHDYIQVRHAYGTKNIYEKKFERMVDILNIIMNGNGNESLKYELYDILNFLYEQREITADEYIEIIDLYANTNRIN